MDVLHVILDRIEPGVTPPYCTHGRVTCVTCDEWCWLGDQTVKVVTDGTARPLCQPCAVKRIPKTAKPVRHIADHLRADGPH